MRIPVPDPDPFVSLTP